MLLIFQKLHQMSSISNTLFYIYKKIEKHRLLVIASDNKEIIFCITKLASVFGKFIKGGGYSRYLKNM